MTYKARVWNNLAGVISFIGGIIYSLTLIGIPIGIMFFIGARRFLGWAQLSDASVVNFKQLIKKWATFESIFVFPFGLISLVSILVLNTKAVISDIEKESVFVFKTEPQDKEEAVQVVEKKEETNNTTSKEETIAKLQHLKDEGLITEEEFDRAKKEVLGK